MINIGVLLPRSTLFSAIGMDILNGVKANLHHSGTAGEFKFITDNIGFGVNEAEVYTKAEKLLLEEDVEIMIVVADTRIEEMLSPLFTASNKILLMVNFGANFPDSWQAPATTITHSLNFCLHTRLTGKLALEEENKNAVYTLSYYDAGYRQTYTMLTAHQQHGGLPGMTHVTGFKDDASFTIAPVEQYLKEHADTKTLLCLFTGDLAARFYKDVKPMMDEYNLCCYVSPMMLQETLASAQLDIKDTKGYIPWYKGLDNEHNRSFQAAYREKHKKEVNSFVLLGWETGILLNNILQEQANGADATATGAALGNKTFDSPRGWFKLDAATGHSFGPSWLVNCRNNMELTIEKEFPGIETEWRSLTAEVTPQGLASSWRNTYLCI
jgi:branched-chain amino acid transport system substrate-binding protein